MKYRPILVNTLGMQYIMLDRICTFHIALPKDVCPVLARIHRNTTNMCVYKSILVNVLFYRRIHSK